MRKSKGIKLLKITAIGFLLLFVFILLFLKYRDYKSYQQVVHADAGILIKVNVDQLIKKTAFDYLLHKPESKVKDTIVSIHKKEKFKGFSYPANIFVNNLKEKPNTYITSMPISDTLNIKSFLRTQLKINSFERASDFNYGYSKNNKIEIVYNDEKLVIAYSFKKEDVKNILEEILLQKNVVRANEEKYKSLQKSNADIVVFKNEKNKLKIDFNSTDIVIDGNISLIENIDIPVESLVNKPSKNAYMYGWFTGNFESYNFKEQSLNSIALPIDSLLNHYTKSIQIETVGKVLQKDTIITYEYDDDFEKVEVISLQEKEVPGINIQLNGNAYKTLNLLEREHIVNNNTVNNKFFPLYHLNFQKENEKTLVFSNTTILKDRTKQKTQNFFHLFADVSRLVNEIELPVTSKYIDCFKKITLSAKKSNDKINVSGSVEMKSDEMNALLQIIFNK